MLLTKKPPDAKVVGMDFDTCGHNEYRFIVVRDGLPNYTAAITTNRHELPALACDLAKAYRSEPGAQIRCQRRWVDAWSEWSKSGR